MSQLRGKTEQPVNSNSPRNLNCQFILSCYKGILFDLYFVGIEILKVLNDLCLIMSPSLMPLEAILLLLLNSTLENPFLPINN